MFLPVLRLWLPLAMSMLLIAIELPIISALLARSTDAHTALAAFGGIVYPIGLLIECPVFLFTGASTTLSRNWQSFRVLLRFLHILCSGLTLVHLIVVATPLYSIVTIGIVGASPELADAAWLPLVAALPWSWAVGYRRVLQGVLIRFNLSAKVGWGTLIRLGTGAIVLVVGARFPEISGAMVGTLALTISVIVEAMYVQYQTKRLAFPILQSEHQDETAPSLAEVTRFYIPLGITSFLQVAAIPLGTAALFRMPAALDSIAIWPIVSGLVFICRSPAFAYTEAVVALVEHPERYQAAKRFAILLGCFTSLLLALIAGTALASIWFDSLMGLSEELVELSTNAIGYAVLLPALTAMASWFQGILLYGKRTRAVTESMVVYLGVMGGVLALGAVSQLMPGITVYLIALTLAIASQTAWMRFRASTLVAQLEQSARS